ncbi:MAG TPA: AAA family ATPase [Terriglobales bacterium]|nr:AAA family ATPase [Terriglobales bacterium]
MLRKDGEFWTLSLDGTVIHLKDSRGLGYIARLVSHPGTPFHVFDLIAAGLRSEPGDKTSLYEELRDAGVHVRDLGDAGAMLDERAKRAYRGRLTELSHELEEAKSSGQVERAERIEREIEQLRAELTRAVGLRGRIRRSASNVERARQAVSKAISRVLERLTAMEPAIAAALKRNIRTGTFCVFEPAPDGPVVWQVGVERDTEPDRVAERPSGLRQRPPLETGRNEGAFVGRQAELAGLRGLVDEALSGRGGVALIGGEPGVGKTRLAVEVANYALARGMCFFLGRCHEDESYPFRPCAQMIERALQMAGREEFRRRAQAHLPELVHVAPRLERFFPELCAAAERSAPQARIYLFESICECILVTARENPMLLLFDDLHWADESTLAILKTVVRRAAEAGLAIIATYRDGAADIKPPLKELIEEILRLGARPLHLSGLSREDVTEMLHNFSPRPASSQIVKAVFDRTRGNPFFVEEVLKHLAEEGKLHDEQQLRSALERGEMDVPPNLRLVLGRRLDRLQDTTRQILTMAAVLGPQFNFSLLTELYDGEQVEQLLGGIEEAEHAGMIAPVPAETDAVFEFRHELLRQTLLSYISLPRRQHLHLRAADALERRNDQMSRILSHLTQAGSLADPQRLVRYLIAAGKSELRAGGYHEALHYFEQALGRLSFADSRTRADLLSDLALAERGLGRWPRALEYWNQSLEIYAKLGDRERMGRVLIQTVSMLIWFGRLDEAREVAERGLLQQQGEPSPTYARLLATAALLSSRHIGHHRASDSFQEGLNIATRLADLKLAGELLCYRSLYNFFFLDLHEALEDANHSVELTTSVSYPWHRAVGLCTAQQALYHLGRAAEASRIAAELEPVARRMGHLPVLCYSRWIQAWSEFGSNPDLATLGATMLELLHLSLAAELPLTISVSQAETSLVEFYRGNWNGAVKRIEEARIHPFHGFLEGLWDGLRFRLLAYLGERSKALDLLAAKRCGLPRLEEASSFGAWAMLVLVVEGLWVLGERDFAADLYPQACRLIEKGVVCIAWISRFSQTAAGLAAAAAGNWPIAEEHFHLALRQAEQLPHRLEATEVRRFLGSMLIERDGRDDRQRALELLNEAARAYDALGMPRHARLTEALVSRALDH